MFVNKKSEQLVKHTRDAPVEDILLRKAQASQARKLEAGVKNREEFAPAITDKARKLERKGDVFKR